MDLAHDLPDVRLVRGPQVARPEARGEQEQPEKEQQQETVPVASEDPDCQGHALVAPGPNGIMYRLRNALFDVSGPGSLSLDSRKGLVQLPRVANERPQVM